MTAHPSVNFSSGVEVGDQKKLCTYANSGPLAQSQRSLPIRRTTRQTDGPSFPRGFVAFAVPFLLPSLPRSDCFHESSRFTLPSKAIVLLPSGNVSAIQSGTAHAAFEIPASRGNRFLGPTSWSSCRIQDAPERSHHLVPVPVGEDCAEISHDCSACILSAFTRFIDRCKISVFLTV
jgi:hypothetical protein